MNFIVVSRKEKRKFIEIFLFLATLTVCLDGKYLFKVNNRDSRTRSTEFALMSILAVFVLKAFFSINFAQIYSYLKILELRAFVNLLSVIIQRLTWKNLLVFAFFLGIRCIVFHAKIYFVFSMQIFIYWWETAWKIIVEGVGYLLTIGNTHCTKNEVFH